MLGETWTVYRKEMRAYLMSPIPYVVIVLFAGYVAWRFFFEKDVAFFLYDKASMYRGFFFRLEHSLVVLVPAITMRLWSEEATAGTLETLMTAPVRTGSLVLGKFFSAWTLILFCLLATATVPITVSSLGEMDWGPVLGGYLGAFFFCGALLALGLWLSAICGYQIVSFFVTLVTGAVFVIMFEFAEDVGSFFGPVFMQLSLVSHYQAMGRGIVHLPDLVYFLSFLIFFLYLNAQSIENRRYR